MEETWSTPEEQQKAEGISRRTFFRNLKKGDYEVQYVAAPGKGRGGKQLRIRPKRSHAEADGKNQIIPTQTTRKVSPHRFGCEVITELRNGVPIVSYGESSVIGKPTPVSDTLPVPLTTPKATPHLEQIAYARVDLIKALQTEFNKNGRPRMQIVREFLIAYNSGLLMPDIFEQLGKISQATLYNWLRAYSSSGAEALIPNYGGAGESKITDDEKNFILTQLLHQNKIKVGTAIGRAKDLLRMKDLPSPSSPPTLRRWV